MQILKHLTNKVRAAKKMIEEKKAQENDCNDTLIILVN